MVYKIFSVALSFLVVFSSLSLTIEKHFCGDTLVDVAMFAASEKCADDVSETNAKVIIEKSCCKDEVDVIQGLELTTNTSEDLDHSQQPLRFAFSDPNSNFNEALSSLVSGHIPKAQPKLIKDIHLLDETFLI